MSTTERTNSSAERPGLLADSRGAIVIIGIIAGAVLAAAVWHMTSVGNAIVLRNTVQNAADAAAFDNAVIHARGMNVLVGLNLIMALVMSILVAWRVLELLLLFALTAAGVACGLTGFACGALAPLARWNKWFISKDPKVSDKIVKICAGINVVEKVVATVAPPYAMAHSILKTRDDYGIESVLTFSTSVGTPTLITKNIATKGFMKSFTSANSIKEKVVECFKKPTSAKDANKALDPKKGAKAAANPAAKPGGFKKVGAEYWDQGAQRRMGLVFSLPVSEDRLGKLCEMGGNFFDQALPSVLAGHEVKLLGWASSIKGKLFSTVPSIFCAPPTAGTESLGDSIQGMIKEETEKQCKAAKDHFMTLPKEERNKNKYATRAGDFDWKKCKIDAKDEAKKRYRDPNDARKAQDDALKCVKPAKVWEAARNGNPFMQSFSSARSRTSPAPTPPKGPTYPPGFIGPRVPAPPTPPEWLPVSTTSVRAQAEMYFDCKKPWLDCDSSSMWQLKWKARLRRIQPLSEMLGDALASTLAASIVHGGEKILGDKFYQKAPKFAQDPLGTDLKYGGTTSKPRDILEAHLLEWMRVEKMDEVFH